MKDSPHSFVLVFYFNITSGSKVDAKIDLHSYITHQEFNEGMSKKVNKTDYASKEQYGIVKYGTEEGKALEGNKFTQMTGKDYGGILNIAGQKEEGKAYWDNNTKKLYICKNNNSDISPNINNYIPFDNGSILERLENLNRKTKVLFYNGGYVIPNNTVSPSLEDWFYFGFGLGGSSGEDRIGFIIIKIFDSADTYLQFQGVKLHYDSKNKTLKVINNGGNLYFVEQYSCLT